MTGSGKTTWAKKKAHSLQRIEPARAVIVLDPFKRPSWILNPDLCFVTNDRDEFLKTVWASRECSIFVDEAGDEIGRYDDIMNSLATKSRNYGHKCHFIMQRSKQISTTIRTQCAEIVCFQQSYNDTKDLADEFCAPALAKAHELKKGEFIHAIKGGNVSKNNVFLL